MHLLKSMSKHGPIDFAQHVPSNVYSAVWIDSKNVGVVGSMVDLAESQTIGHFRIPPLIVILQNMGCIEKL